SQSRARDAHEASLGPQLVDRRGADVAHTRAQSTAELMHDAVERPERAHATLDSFGDELAELADVRLSVAIARAACFHRTERAHAAVGLESSIGGLDDLARCFVDAREKAADHDRRCARADRLGDIAGVLDATVRADREPVPVRRLRAIEDRGDLRHPGTGDDVRRAYRAGAHTDLHAV